MLPLANTLDEASGARLFDEAGPPDAPLIVLVHGSVVTRVSLKLRCGLRAGRHEEHPVQGRFDV
jgi:hypothetical protein